MRTVVGLYDNFDDAQNAVQALRDADFNKEDINLITRDANGEYKRYLDANPQGESQDVGQGAATGAGVGAVIGGLGGLLVSLGALAIPGIGPVLAAGPIATTLLGAGAGAVAGGIVGALVDLGIPKEHAEIYAEGIRRGGTLVTVRTSDSLSDRALQILNRYQPVNINTRQQDWLGTEGQDLNENVQPTAMDQTETGPQDMESMGMQQMDTDRDQDIQSVDTSPADMERDEAFPSSLGANQPGTNRIEDFQSSLGAKQLDMENDEDFEPMKVDESDTERMENIPVTGSEQGMDTPVMEEEVTEETVVDTGNMPANSQSDEGSVVESTEKGDFQSFSPDFRNHFDSNYGSQGMSYIDFMPAYQFGYNLGTDTRFGNYDWNAIEPEARNAWERRYGQGTWDMVREAVHYAWDAVRM